jgi:predicted transcriptional regulator
LQAAGATYLQVQTTDLLRGLRVKDVMSTDYQSVDPNTSLQEFVHEQLLRTERRCFLVVQDSRLLGLITPNEVRAVEPQAWPYTVRNVMRPADTIHSVSPATPTIEALETMGRQDVNQLPVVADGRLEGIVSRAHVLQVIRSRAELKLPPSLPRTA